MHTWMLTGDNGYTARSVAVNCGLILNDVAIVSIKTSEIPEIPTQVYQVLIEGIQVRPELSDLLL